MWQIALAQTAIGAYQGYKADKAQNRADRAQRRMASRYQDYVDRYNQNYLPLEQALLDDVNNGVDTDALVADAQANYNDQFDNSQAMLMRDMSARGVNPGSGRYVSALEDSAYERAAGLADAGNSARRQADDLQWSRRIAALAHGQGQLEMGLAGMSGNVAYQSNQAANYGNAAVAALSGAAQTYGSYLSNRNQSSALGDTSYENKDPVNAGGYSGVSTTSTLSQVRNWKG